MEQSEATGKELKEKGVVDWSSGALSGDERCRTELLDEKLA